MNSSSYLQKMDPQGTMETALGQGPGQEGEEDDLLQAEEEDHLHRAEEGDLHHHRHKDQGQHQTLDLNNRPRLLSSNSHLLNSNNSPLNDNNHSSSHSDRSNRHSRVTVILREERCRVDTRPVPPRLRT